MVERIAFEIPADGPDKTKQYAGALSGLTEEGDVILLDGDLGAGKTFFARALLHGMGIEESVISPTFVIVREYENRLRVFHADLYRINPEDFFALGYEDIIESQGVFVIEWGSKIADFLDSYLLVNFEILSVDARVLQIKAVGKRGKTLAEKWQKNLF